MATILDLLMALNRDDLPPLPAPAKPLPMTAPPIAGPDFQSFPEEPPAAPLPALDEGLIARIAGAQPTPPVQQQPSTLQRIALALQGFGAGVQGQGPQFLAGLQEQRDRPRREYERNLERFEGRKLQGVELAERRRERQQEVQQRAAERAFQREWDDRAKQLDLKSQTERDLLRDTLLAKRQREDDERQAERLEIQQKQQDKIKLAQLASGYRKLGAKDNIASELARKDLDPNVRLSPGAAKWESAKVRLDELRANKIAAGGTGGGGGGGGTSGNATSLERQFNALKARFLRAEKPIQSAPRGDRGLMERIAAQFPAIMDKLEKLGYEVGFDPSGIYPYIKPPQGQATQPTAQATGEKTATMEDIRAYMAAEGVDEAEARRRAQAAGYKVQ